MSLRKKIYRTGFLLQTRSQTLHLGEKLLKLYTHRSCVNTRISLPSFTSGSRKFIPKTTIVFRPNFWKHYLLGVYILRPIDPKIKMVQYLMDQRYRKYALGLGTSYTTCLASTFLWFSVRNSFWNQLQLQESNGYNGKVILHQTKIWTWPYPSKSLCLKFAPK